MNGVKTIKLFAYLLSQIVLVLLLLECVGRLFDPLGISYYPETAAYMDTLIIEEPIGYRNQPNLTGNFFGVPVSINSIGLRDQEVSAKTNSEFRILVMGDSMPFGIGVQVEDSFPAQLEQLLQQNSTSQKHIHTLNLGVPSYNTEQELTQLKQIGMGLEPDLVALLFSANDLQAKMWIFDKRRSWFTDLAQRSYAASLIYTAYKHLKRRFANVKPIEKPRTAVTKQQPSPPSRAANSAWNSVQRSLSEMNILLKRRGIPFLLFTFNEAPQYTKNLSEIGKTEDIPVIHLDSSTDRRWDRYEPKETSNSVTDSHPNELGNRIIATMMADYLILSGYVPRLH